MGCAWQLLGLLVYSVTAFEDGADYYEILGVKRRASTAEIKAAYRKKSLQYHPDKCKEEDCQSKFIKIGSVYEVLSDPEKRQIYNEKGEAGLKDDGGQNNEAMFEQFFGRKPNGKVRVRRGPFGQMFFEEEGEAGPSHNLYEKSNVTEFVADSFSVLKNRQEPWVILFYKTNREECRKMRNDFRNLANTYHEIVEVGAVNCMKEHTLCSDASIKEWPSIRWFTEDEKADPLTYEGDLTYKAMAKWVSAMMPNYVTKVDTMQMLRDFVGTAEGPPVLLFTDKSSAPPMWKALSRVYHKRAALGIVTKCDKNGVFKTPLQKEFDVNIPGIIHIDSVNLGVKEKFSSSLKMPILTLWLRKLVAVQKTRGVASFKEWTPLQYDNGTCGPKDSQFCFMWLKAGADAKVEKAVHELADKYATDPIKIMWINTELNPSILETFDLGENEDALDFFVAFRPKRRKFKIHEGELAFAELDAFVEGVLSGGMLPKKIAKDPFFDRDEL